MPPTGTASTWPAKLLVACAAIALTLGLTSACKPRTAAAKSGKPAAGGYTVRGLHYEIEHEPDGKRYPNQVKESYALEADGTLRYSAYFGGMPIEMNHMDSLDWKSGAHGQKVLDVVSALLADPERQAELKILPDDAPSPPFADKHYLVQLTKDKADSTRYAKDPKTRAFRELDQAFTALITAFEKATGRPRSPGSLPQR
jgi:hypothetical protein